MEGPGHIGRRIDKVDGVQDRHPPRPCRRQKPGAVGDDPVVTVDEIAEIAPMLLLHVDQKKRGLSGRQGQRIMHGRIFCQACGIRAFPRARVSDA